MEKGIYVCEGCGGKGTVERYDPKVLRETRKKAGIGVREMARALGFSAAFISDVELGRRNPNEKIITYLESL